MLHLDLMDEWEAGNVTGHTRPDYHVKRNPNGFVGIKQTPAKQWVCELIASLHYPSSAVAMRGSLSIEFTDRVILFESGASTRSEGLHNMLRKGELPRNRRVVYKTKNKAIALFASIAHVNPPVRKYHPFVYDHTCHMALSIIALRSEDGIISMYAS